MSSTPAPESPPRTERIVGGILITLTLTRWLVPSEATAEGETLWIAGLWLLAGAILCMLPTRRLPRRPWDVADFAVLLFVGGHVLSGMMVVCTTGDRRAAVNLLWEWLSLGVCWFAWREAIRCRSIRQTVMPVLLVTAVTLSLWGMYQYFVWYPQMQAAYGPLFDQLRQLRDQGGDTSAVLKQLGDAGIPTEGPSLELFRNRLQNSQEPFGPFALANTLGGLLAAWLVLGLGMTLGRFGFLLVPSPLQGERARERGGDVSHRSPPHPNPLPRNGGEGTAQKRQIPLVAAGFLALIAFALYLTNSRTAWCGALAALAAGLVVVVAQKIPTSHTRRWLFPAATLAACMIGVAGLWWIMQGVHEVPGPLKSLAYRAEYWIGTEKLLATTPWRGVGLGQFRDRYLQFKTPQSSEEIADPHNLLLDVWANGGAIAVAGLGLLIGVLWRQIWRLTTDPILKTIQSPPLATAGPPPSAVWIMPGAFAFGITLLVPLGMTGVWDNQTDHLLMFLIIWLAAAWSLSRSFLVDAGDVSWCGVLAAVALSVHLLGAGGIAMPAVTQLWLLLILWGITPARDETPAESPPGPRLAPFLISGCCLALCAGWFWTAQRPVLRAKQSLDQGDLALATRQEPDRALREYRQAATDDPWAADPWMRVAQLEFSRAIADLARVDRDHLKQAVQAADAAIARAPDRPSLQIRKAEWLKGVADRTQQPADWNAARQAYQAALPRHPTNAALLANLAMALLKTGAVTEAAEMSRLALAQDDLNRDRGHAERYLPDALRRELTAIPAASP